jgi:5,10-methylene-tetrahydrofolate dehydrogenase/Methenyl tetrahydrofolate cyclohydrolase
MSIILDGKLTSDKIKAEISNQVKQYTSQGKRAPHLAAILVGNDGGSMTYVANKERACKVVGFNSTILRFEDTITQEELLSVIDEINNNNEIDGLIVQLPLPKHIDENKIIEAISPLKDVDGFHPINIGKMMIGIPSFLPATPFGIIKLLEEYNIETSGKHCVILGRSNIVGKPLANLLIRKAHVGNCTVTICHSKTKNIEKYTKDADIIIAAMGVPHFLKGDMVKEGVVVVDVGTTRVVDSTKKSGFSLHGDVEFSSVEPKSSYISPVPGGVGPMTIVSLMYNTLQSYKQKIDD